MTRQGFVAALLITTLSHGTLSQPSDIVPERALVVGGVLGGGRVTFPLDPVQHLIVTGQWRTPAAGATIRGSGGIATWREIRSSAPGVFRDPSLRGGYALLQIPASSASVMVLRASGHSMVYVNNEPRVGNPYGYGYARVPVVIRPGQNELLFACGRGELSVKLEKPPLPVMLNVDDATIPDLVAGEAGPQLGAVVLINASENPLRGAVLEARLDGKRPVRSDVPTVPPVSLRKVPFRIPNAAETPGREANLELCLYVRRRGKLVRLSDAALKIGIRKSSETRKCTFLSAIDRSVQYFAVVPPRAEPTQQQRPRPPALTLTCHGAGVEALGQAASYAPKRGMWIVAPTNRRPYGFDWEEWGRMDAMEVLDLAQQRFGTDPLRTYLTGHSMGGHGSWHLSVTFPNRFATVGPSAGWISFQSYAGAQAPSDADPLQSILSRAAAPSNTLSLIRNLGPLGVYILHGDQDDNVPVTEARTMAARLQEFHRDFTLYEQPGAGHWWGAPSDPGAGCVDWPPMFDLFQRRIMARPDETRHVDFTTANPGVSATMQWLTIHQQIVPLKPSSASLRCDPAGRRFVGTTDNVALLELSLLPFDGDKPVQVDLDGTKLSVPCGDGKGSVYLQRSQNGWRLASPPPLEQKRPGRAGPFKEAFSHGFVLVYGTAGTAEENAWAFRKARCDAETFWYRGNGAPEILADTEFDLKSYRDRSVILYGNADTNRLWTKLLPTCPVQVTRGAVKVGDRAMTGDDLACLFCFPRHDSAAAYVAVVCGTGLTGMRLTDRAPYFISGTPFPDLLVWTPDVLLKGTAGVRAAGFFGNDWSVSKGDFAFAP